MIFYGKFNRVFILNITIYISFSGAFAADINNIEFNTDLLDVSDKKNIDLGSFSKPGFIMPGEYILKAYLNNNYFSQQPITFIASNEEGTTSEACLTPDMVKQFGLLNNIVKQLRWDSNHCLVIDSLEGMTIKSDLSTASIKLNIPQAYLEYRTDSWDPPSLWDNGVDGVIFDYNLTSRSVFQHHSNLANQTNVSANGLVGINIDAWRIRANWQANYLFYEGSNNKDQHDFSWQSIYAYRAIPSLKSQLSLGENYLNSDLFDSFRYTGVSLMSDVSMLPPNLRGYAPQVTGVAQSNATVIISQQGRIIYQTQVPAGPFKIQNLNDTVSGKLNVKIEEQDGTVREFDVDTATIPYLTRPGSVRYKTFVGRPTTYDHHVQGDLFASGEFSWGVSNGWSIFGGSLNSKDYHAVALGVGRDLLAFGALSFDITQSFADFSNQGRLEGRSYRLNYAKQFKQYNSQIQFAGYRFAEKNYFSMSDFLSLKDSNTNVLTWGHSKEMYTISLNKMFPEHKTSVYLNLNHQTYWDRTSRDYFNLMVSKSFNFTNMKNVSFSLSAYQNKSETKDNGFYVAVSLPLDSGASVNYAYSQNSNDTTQQLSFYNRLDDRTTYQVNVNHSDLNKVSANAYVTHIGNRARVTANVSSQDQSSSAGFTVQGGMTLTAFGADFHRISSLGSTRIMIDTNKAEDIPVQAYGPTTLSNRFGTVVISDLTNYYKNRIKVNLNKMPKNADVADSILYSTLTQGAIGYREFDVLKGETKLVTIHTNNGDNLPFGTRITNEKGRSTGLVDDNGLVYLSGISIQERMVANLGNDKKCFITFSEKDLANKENDTLICEIDNR